MFKSDYIGSDAARRSAFGLRADGTSIGENAVLDPDSFLMRARLRSGHDLARQPARSVAANAPDFGADRAFRRDPPPEGTGDRLTLGLCHPRKDVASNHFVLTGRFRVTI